MGDHDLHCDCRLELAKVRDHLADANRALVRANEAITKANVGRERQRIRAARLQEQLDAITGPLRPGPRHRGHHMRALTIRQPWATLIAHGIKTIETRVWHTNYRGPLAIHAAKTDTDRHMHQHPEAWAALGKLIGGDAPTRGAIVATGRLAGCMPIGRCHEPDHESVPASGCVAVRWPEDQAWLVTPSPSGAGRLVSDVTDQLPLGDYQPGRWGWLLTDIRMLPAPVPAKGRQGLWTPDARIVAQLGLEATA